MNISNLSGRLHNTIGYDLLIILQGKVIFWATLYAFDMHCGGLVI